jgi:hypothetical protein
MSVHGPSSIPNLAHVPSPAARARATAPPAAPVSEPASERSLLELLTDDERAFFAQQAALGPLTYGRSRGAAAPAAAPSAPIGQRLDVKA